MPITRLLIEDFITLSKQYPVFDVRSEGEYQHARFPNAHSLPLFTNEERKVVGTAYKQESKQKAIKLGLEYFGPKMVKMVEEVERVVGGVQLTVDGNKNRKKETKPIEIADKVVLVYCWRGGMRSAGVAWLLDLYGFKVYTLVGGYKSYRNWVLKQFEKEYPFKIIGGYTGSGKTEVLHALAQQGETVIDLEGLACHRGSAFGNLGQPQQPKQEMFENLLANALAVASANNSTIWLEDESQRIGEVNIPISIFKYMRTCRVYFLDIPFEERLNYILKGYGSFDKEKLINATIRIKKRLGGLETKNAVNYLIEDDFLGAFGILLHYYDRLYTKSMSNMRENPEMLFHKIAVSEVSHAEKAKCVIIAAGKEKVY
ncbi:MAG: tRNA 2-selenouridine(34) synthase MnmH [Sediminibacterium sp.]|jgi:tRNA 2-selenouridine synthase|uniref:tRNA 2-selenouridine(34) synthase MnmH n=1 Tax=Sediminibacterium sp. TaxID=1917865 RepID=UPI002AB923B6|nr:tRNA 2-selenouridine(34) synthase MnmH [Sediminibacterium sp.]MDZ4071934.1 tRNA 2-selenouridine(34) synthase MnmH [Sediminibacterium sp.]